MNKINNLASECCGIHAKRNVITSRYIEETIRDNIGTIIKGGIPIKSDIDDPKFIVYTRVNNSIENLRTSIISKCLRGIK